MNPHFREEQLLQHDVIKAPSEHGAKPFCVLEGYNGTIFAYGQTGSGKTFTITGGLKKFADRGIIPRTLSYMFDTFEKYPDKEFCTHISYLEIYNENGYDLLDPKHEASKLEDPPKVTLFEDADQNINLKNLSLRPSANEEDALNLLFLGDTNRMMAETPMNQASTRSHCIFTIHIVSRVVGSATVRRSKLHLVDLAGSEPIGKTGTQGLQATEAKCNNLSLHYLEQVIVALSEKNRPHIPYRNSMMTSVLRDSLGGNCMTAMIATCSVEELNIDIIIRGLFIGVVFSVGALQFCTCSWAPSFGLYLVVLSFFHWSEYFVTAVTHESHATIDSYLLSHSNAYRIAALASWIEFFVEMWVFTDFKTSMFAYYCRIVGLCIVIIGEILRKGAMITARTNFNHYVRHVREDGHVLVTHGLYACFRHPAYVGWFYWSIGTQILLCNPICTLAYTLASWKFFDERIRTEEMTLLNFFGKDYTEYQKRVGTGLPFIKGYTLES